MSFRTHQAITPVYSDLYVRMEEQSQSSDVSERTEGAYVSLSIGSQVAKRWNADHFSPCLAAPLDALL